MLHTLKGVMCALVVSFAVAVAVFAQAGQFKPGDKIDYMDYGKWETGGTFVGSTPGDKQPIIRKRPNEYDPQGSQTAWDWERIRPTAGANAPQPPRNPPRQDPPPPPAPPDDPPAGDDGGGDVDGCMTMLTENDVLSFLQRKLGNNKPYDWQRKQAVETELAGMIRDCGVAFRFKTLSTYSDQLDKYDATSVVRYPLMGNMGPPTRQNWYIGTWAITAQSENYWMIIAAKAGFLTIGANGTYVWKNGPNDPPARYVKGKWRPATVEEMKVAYQGGAGVVLLNAVGGDDWLIRHNRDSRDPTPGRWVAIELLEDRQNRVWGYQK